MVWCTLYFASNSIINYLKLDIICFVAHDFGREKGHFFLDMKEVEKDKVGTDIRKAFRDNNSFIYKIEDNVGTRACVMDIENSRICKSQFKVRNSYLKRALAREETKRRRRERERERRTITSGNCRVQCDYCECVPLMWC